MPCSLAAGGAWVSLLHFYAQQDGWESSVPSPKRVLLAHSLPSGGSPRSTLGPPQRACHPILIRVCHSSFAFVSAPAPTRPIFDPTFALSICPHVKFILVCPPHGHVSEWPFAFVARRCSSVHAYALVCRFSVLPTRSAHPRHRHSPICSSTHNLDPTLFCLLTFFHVHLHSNKKFVPRPMCLLPTHVRPRPVCRQIALCAMLQAVLFAFAMFEGLLGIYWPAIALLRATALDEATRSSTMAVFRLLLNLLVITALPLAGVHTQTFPCILSDIPYQPRLCRFAGFARGFCVWPLDRSSFALPLRGSGGRQGASRDQVCHRIAFA